MKTERILGALYGQALGDAMGMPSELWPRSRVKAHFGWIDRFLPGPKENNAACYFNRAEFTDDTSMALCLADALLEREGEIDPDLIGRKILDWALRFDAFNKNVLGPTSKIALNAIRDGKPVAELENNGVTNGAAMRVSPLGCLLPARDVDSFIDDVALASSPTHKSDLAIAGAVVIAWAISRAIDGESWSAIVDSLPSIARHAQQKRITTFSASLAARLEIALKIVRHADGTESASEQLYQVIGAGTSTIESVPCAIALVELAQTDPNRCAILCANLGGDTDTIGAMATAICGALHGVNAIDPALKAELDAVNQLDFNRYATALAKDKSLYVRLPFVTDEEIPVTVVGCNRDAEGNLAVIFECVNMSEALSSIRHESMEILLVKHKGLRVPKRAITTDAEQHIGVYIRAGDVVRFRRIEQEYGDAADYVICKENGQSGYLRLYDDVITEGSNLYDGKLIR